tara:strand:+ start:43 stop:249 length:207 start_codon:yes stop_codon:yes gene_type:complete
VSGRTKKYFKFNDNGLSQAKLVYIIKWLDQKDAAIKYEGPFLKEEDAICTLNEFLKRGLCSWIIRYDD